MALHSLHSYKEIHKLALLTQRNFIGVYSWQ